MKKSVLGLGVILGLMFLFQISSVYADGHFFCDGEIPTSVEGTIGVFKFTGNLFGDFTTVPLRFEFGFSKNFSGFVQGELINIDTILGSASTSGVGAGGMYRVIEDNNSIPFNLSLRGGVFHYFSKDEYPVSISAWTELDASVIASKNLKKQINFDLTPYASLNGAYGIYDDKTDGSSNDTAVTFALGARARFAERFSVFGEVDLGDRDGWGAGFAYAF